MPSHLSSFFDANHALELHKHGRDVDQVVVNGILPNGALPKDAVEL